MRDGAGSHRRSDGDIPGEHLSHWWRQRAYGQEVDCRRECNSVTQCAQRRGGIAGDKPCPPDRTEHGYCVGGACCNWNDDPASAAGRLVASATTIDEPADSHRDTVGNGLDA